MTKQLGRILVALLWMAGAIHLHAQNLTVPAELVAYPDLIVYNAKIVTINDPSLNDSPGRIVQAMAVRGDTIQFLGSNDAILRYAGSQTRKIDLKGRTVIPGLIDTHNHLHNGAVSAWAQANPQKVESIAKRFEVPGKTFQDLARGIELVIKEQMARPEPGQYAMIGLSGQGTNVGEQYLLTQQMTRKDLDALAPKLPVVIQSGPIAALWNTAARDDFMRYYDVEPTDESEKWAIQVVTVFGRSLIADRYFDRHIDELADVLEEHLKKQASLGFTTYSSHIVGLRFTPAFRKLVREGRMPMRFGFSHRLCQQVEPDMAGCFLRVGDFAGMGDKYFWNVGLTLGSVDGIGTSICSTMERPAQYREQEQCRVYPGSPYWKAIYTALRSRYRYVTNHMAGDKAADAIMNVQEQVMKENPDITLEVMRSLRVSGDHCHYYPSPANIPRMQRLGWIISCGPVKLNTSAPYLKGVYGMHYANYISPMKSLISGGVMTSTEYEGLRTPGKADEALSPFAVLIRFITRKNDKGELIALEEAIDRVTAMKSTTIWGAHYVLKEKEIGSLEPGKLADFVVLNKDYFTVPVDEIATVYPLMTVLGGKTMMLREELAKELGLAPVGVQYKFQFKAEVNPDEVVNMEEMM